MFMDPTGAGQTHTESRRQEQSANSAGRYEGGFHTLTDAHANTQSLQMCVCVL